MVDLRDMSIFVRCIKTVTYWITRFLLHNTRPISHILSYFLCLETSKYEHTYTIQYCYAVAVFQVAFILQLTSNWHLVGGTRIK